MGGKKKRGKRRKKNVNEMKINRGRGKGGLKDSKDEGKRMAEKAGIEVEMRHATMKRLKKCFKSDAKG